MFELNFIENKTNEPSFELNFAKILRVGLNLAKKYSKIG